MSPKKELKVGLVLWGVGMASILALAFTTPRFFNEGMAAAGITATLGFVLILCAMLDMFVDDFHDDIKKEQKNNGG